MYQTVNEEWIDYLKAEAARIRNRLMELKGDSRFYEEKLAVIEAQVKKSNR